jgi:gamma-glutamylaminecyclotransferase
MKSNVNQNLLFVYGTLKRGNGNHRLLKAIKAEFVAEVSTAEKLPLIVRGLPYLLNKPGTGYHVKGELFNLVKGGWSELDRLEGHPRFYRREFVDVRDTAGNVLRVQTYFLNLENTRGSSRAFNPVDMEMCREEYLDPEIESIHRVHV